MRRTVRTLRNVVLVVLLVPATAQAAAPPRVLVYSGTAGFRHISITHAKDVIGRLAKDTGRFEATFIDQPAQLTKERLAASDIVLWLSSTGAASPFSDDQEQDYVDWVGCGGGHVGVHASADSYKDWPAWLELTGAFFASHPLTPTSAADDRTPESEGWGEPEATILVKHPDDPVNASYPGDFRQRDEYYAWDRDPAKVIADFAPLLAFGGFTDPTVQAGYGANYAAEQPLAWTGTFRHRGRIYYTNLGHSVVTWDRKDFTGALLNGIAWVAGRRPAPKGTRTRVMVRVPKGFRPRSATVRIGRALRRVSPIRAQRGRIAVPVDLTDRHGTVTVRITLRGATRTLRTTRHYTVC